MLCADRIVLRSTLRSYDAALELVSRSRNSEGASLHEIIRQDSKRNAAAKRQPGGPRARPYQTSRTEASLDGLGLDVVGVGVEKQSALSTNLQAFSTGLFVVSHVSHGGGLVQCDDDDDGISALLFY
jgi:hypothetical protein